MMAPMMAQDSTATALCATAIIPLGNTARCPIQVQERRLARAHMAT
ncbi:hypothetical protein [Achromobacter insolitus]